MALLVKQSQSPGSQRGPSARVSWGPQRDECSNRMTCVWPERLESRAGLKAPIRAYTSATSEPAPQDEWGLGGVAWRAGGVRYGGVEE